MPETTDNQITVTETLEEKDRIYKRPLRLSSIEEGNEPAVVRARPSGTWVGIEPLSFDAEQKPVTAWRLTDRGFRARIQQSIPICDDDNFISRTQVLLLRARSFDLAHLYLAMECRFGRSVEDIDDWKQSFRFPLLLEVGTGDSTINYLLIIQNIRSRLNFGLYRQGGGMEPVDFDGIHQPITAEFSRAEINECGGYLLEYASLYFAKYLDEYKGSFHLAVAANNILFGCLRGRFYYRETKSLKEFEAWKASLAAGELQAREIPA